MRTIFALIAAALMLAACTVRPILNVSQEPIPTRIDLRPHTQADVEQAILRAAHRRKWSARIVKSGHIEASTAARAHRAVVDIRYDTQTYDIRLKQSENLAETDSTIHRNYNRWVANLSKEIRRQLSRQAGY